MPGRIGMTIAMETRFEISSPFVWLRKPAGSPGLFAWTGRSDLNTRTFLVGKDDDVRSGYCTLRYANTEFTLRLASDTTAPI